MKWHNVKYLTREGFHNLWTNRTMTLASVAVLISCLLLTGAAMLFSQNMGGMMKSLEGSNSTTVYLEEDDEEETWQIVTTVRQDVLHGLISKGAPMGSALLGKKVGDRFYVQVNKDYGYYAQVRAIEKGKDDGTVALNRF